MKKMNKDKIISIVKDIEKAMRDIEKETVRLSIQIMILI